MPSNIRYYNQTAPFWDFVANLENNAGNHPFFSAYNPDHRRGDRPSDNTQPHRDSPPPPDPQSPPPPPVGDHPPPPHSPHDHLFGPGFPFGGHHHPGNHRSGCGGRRGPGRWGGGPFSWGGNEAMDPSKIAEFFASQFAPSPETNSKDSTKDFSPAADVFDTDDAYVIHISLPGAKKEDVGVNWDADKSELSVAGVVYRPGDEEFLKTLAMDERGKQVGVFERKIRLGSRTHPANVEEEGMGAKMEDGVLVVRVPKRDSGYVEVKKVDIE